MEEGVGVVVDKVIPVVILAMVVKAPIVSKAMAITPIAKEAMVVVVEVVVGMTMHEGGVVVQVHPPRKPSGVITVASLTIPHLNVTCHVGYVSPRPIRPPSVPRILHVHIFSCHLRDHQSISQRRNHREKLTWFCPSLPMRICRLANSRCHICHQFLTTLVHLLLMCLGL
jgi:hypothetical protein